MLRSAARIPVSSGRSHRADHQKSVIVLAVHRRIKQGVLIAVTDSPADRCKPGRVVCAHRL